MKSVLTLAAEKFFVDLAKTVVTYYSHRGITQCVTIDFCCVYGSCGVTIDFLRLFVIVSYSAHDLRIDMGLVIKPLNRKFSIPGTKRDIAVNSAFMPGGIFGKLNEKISHTL